MNKKLKAGLKSAFVTPQPAKKADFLKDFAYPKASRLDFFASQIGYIRKRIWLCSALLFSGSLLAMHHFAISPNVVWAVSSVLPFLALITMSEVTRSRFCGIAELEASCKHSLTQVTLVRLMVLGGMNFLILLAILLSFIGKTDFGFFRLGVYLLMPFLLNSYALLLITNRFKGRETMYASSAITGFISLSNILLTTNGSMAFTDKYVAFWVVAFIFLTIAVVREITKLIKKTEELEWSLSLIA